MPKVLVTGGAGFIGSNLIGELVSSGHKVFSIDDYSTGKKENHVSGCEYLVGNVSQKEAFECIPEVDVVFHLAARARIVPSFKDPAGYFKANATGTMIACGFALKRGVPLVYAGTGSHHGGRCRNPYTFSKAVGEDIVRMHREMGLKCSITRFFNVYGPNESMEEGVATLIGSWRGKLQKGETPIIYGDGSKTRDFTHVSDITDALILVIQKNAWGFEFDLGRGFPRSVLEISRMFGGKFKYMPDRPGEVQDSLCDNSLARGVLGWNPSRDIEDHLCSVKKWKKTLSKTITPAMRQANQIKQNARLAFQNMVAAFNNGSKQFWQNPQASPSQIASALGTDAREVFELHAKLGALLSEVRPQAIQEGVSVVGNFTYNEDGTVTIKPPVSSENS